MTLEFNWFIPADGDGRHLINSSLPHLKDKARGNRPPTFEYLLQVARAAEQGRFKAVLIPTGSSCEDSWLLASALASQTTRLKYLVAFRPGFESPAFAAEKAVALQALSGASSFECRHWQQYGRTKAYGDFLDHEARYRRTDEYLTIVRRLWSGERFDFSGRNYHFRQASLSKIPHSVPVLYFGGASAEAEKVASTHADVYLLWGETPSMVRERLQRVRKLAEQQGRSLRFGIRLHIIARETAQRLIDELPDQAIKEAQKALASQESVGQARMRSLHQGKRGSHVRDLEVYPNLWAGIGLVRTGAGTALVGSYPQVIERIQEYQDLGIDTFILSGYPNLEEAIRVGEEILPAFDSALIPQDTLSRFDRSMISFS
jgi:alkanesulfonate monooxygenase